MARYGSDIEAIEAYASGDISLSDLAEYLDQDLDTTRAIVVRITGKEVKRAKFGNVIVKEDGYSFDSKAEYRRYCELTLLQREGLISDLKVHPIYVLQESFKNKAGKAHRAITHELDFSYIEDGKQVVEDVKGAVTSLWKNKYKLFAQRYPNIDYRVIDA